MRHFPKRSSCHTRDAAIRHKDDGCQVGFHASQSETAVHALFVLSGSHIIITYTTRRVLLGILVKTAFYCDFTTNTIIAVVRPSDLLRV